MNIGLESILMAIPFILPGFLTTHLVKSRTPAAKKSESSFNEVTESLLRSVIIIIILGAITLLLFEFVFLPKNPSYQSLGLTEILKQIYFDTPFLIVWFIIIWIVLSLVIAIVFGIYWDPLSATEDSIATKLGTKSEDLFFRIKLHATTGKHSDKSQIFVRVRMKEGGGEFQGKLLECSYPNDNNRELLLSHAKYYSYQTYKPSEELDFVFIETKNCSSIDFKIMDPK